MRALRWPLLATRGGMLLERLTRAFWPFWSWLFVIWTALAFHLLDQLSVELAYLAMLIGGALVLGFLVIGIRSFRWPSQAAALARLDGSLKGRPLSALADRQAIGANDAASARLWRAHLAAMAERAAAARPVEPDLRISAYDPFGLRYVAATAAVLAALFGAFDRAAPLGDRLTSGGQAIASGPAFEGWIEPPRYTGLPVVYLNQLAEREPLAIPEGSKVTLRLYGQPGAISVAETISDRAADTGSADAEKPADEQDFIASKSGSLTISGGKNGERSWPITVIPDQPPMIAVTGPVERSPAGEMILKFEAADDYGVVGGSATISLDLDMLDRRYGLAPDPEPRDNITLDIPLPIVGDRKDFSDNLVEDLSKHPWAGLPVLVALHSVDDPGQEGLAEPEQILLPGRRFFDPLAAAIVEQRRDLLWNRKNGPRIAGVLRAISNHPEELFDSEKAYLLMRMALRRLESALSGGLDDAMRDEVAEMLWQTALLIEDGDLGDVRERLRRAQDRLSEAIENGATDEELAELMDELRRAMQQYMQALAREAEQNPDQDQAQSGERMEITQNQLQQMLQRIEELSRQGRSDEAQQLLEQLRQMMENMRVARGQQGDQQGQQSMQGLADTMRQQQGLSDDAFRRLQEQFNTQGQTGRDGQGQQGEGQERPGQMPNNGRPGPGQAENGQGTPDSLSPGELAERQGALRHLLESQRQALPPPQSDTGRAAREALRRAGRNMADAERSLDQGDLPQALDDQADALDALREGLENLGREMARNQNPNAGGQGDQAASPDPNSNRDPLGRQSGSVGRIGSEESLLPGQDPYLRSRQLMDEIRRRSGDRSRPKIELDYLERLLDRF
ncbi:MAG: TIGR02302 family protein [Rhodobacteraceae bacterium]|nr:TIGR02302 family protein [Paracoccaceae bacterium]